jgi:hypothetical protein
MAGSANGIVIANSVDTCYEFPRFAHILLLSKVSDAPKEIAHDLGDHGQTLVTQSQVSHGAQTSGPDGTVFRHKQVAQVA